MLLLIERVSLLPFSSHSEIYSINSILISGDEVFTRNFRGDYARRQFSSEFFNDMPR